MLKIRFLLICIGFLLILAGTRFCKNRTSYLENSIEIYTFAMKRYKVRQVINLLKKDGWVLDRTRGDHRQFTNENKPGTVTVAGRLNQELDQGTLNSIWKQAGWK